jgi:hypothetical protein
LTILYERQPSTHLLSLSPNSSRLNPFLHGAITGHALPGVALHAGHSSTPSYRRPSTHAAIAKVVLALW